MANGRFMLVNKPLEAHSSNFWKIEFIACSNDLFLSNKRLFFFIYIKEWIQCMNTSFWQINDDES